MHDKYSNSKHSPIDDGPRLDDLKRQADLQALTESLWGPGRRSGRAVMYQARWRPDDDTASFAVYPNGYFDFGTGEHGSVLDFIMQELGEDLPGAIAWLRRYLGQPDPTPSHRTAAPSRPAADEPPPAEWRREAAALIDRAQAYLWSDAPDAQRVRDYLRQVRGLDDATIRAARIGYNPRWTRTRIQKDNGKRARLAPGILLPYIIDNVTWALRVRTITGNLADALDMPPHTHQDGGTLPKYINLIGSKVSGALYNADAIRDDQPVVLVEGEFDALLAGQLLAPHYTVCTLGGASSRLTARWLHRLRRVPRLLLMLDNDAAGQGATAALADALGDHAVPVTLPPGHDVTDAYHAGIDLSALIARHDNAAWWPDGVPDSWRSALLNYAAPSLAPLVELINTALLQRLLDPHDITVADLSAAVAALDFGMTDDGIRRGLEAGMGLFFTPLQAYKFPTESGGKTPKKGRPADHFSLRTLSQVRADLIAWAKPRLVERHYSFDPETEQIILHRPTAHMLAGIAADADEAAALARELNKLLDDAFKGQEKQRKRAAHRVQRDMARLIQALNNPHSSALPPGFMPGRAREFRAGLLVATNDPGQGRSARQIAALLGITPRSVPAMVRFAGLAKVSPDGEFEDHELSATEDIATQIKAVARQLPGYPRAVIAHLPDGSDRVCPYILDGEDRHLQFAHDHLERGHSISARFQVANRYKVVHEGPRRTEKAASVPEAADPPPKSQPDDAAMAPATAAKLTAHLPQPEATNTHVGDGPPDAPPARHRRPKYYGKNYDPEWLHAQFWTAMSRAGWQQAPGVLIQPQTGEAAHLAMTYAELLYVALRRSGGLPGGNLSAVSPPSGPSSAWPAAPP